MSNSVLNMVIRILMWIFILLVIAYLCVVAKDIGYAIFSDQPKDGRTHAIEKEITITEGESLKEISRDLKSLGIIDHPRYFVAFMHFQDDYDKIKPGTYVVSSADRPSEILKKFTIQQEGEEP